MHIIVPAYNEGSVIGAVLRGISSRYPEAHIVVVNDGSSDDTREQAVLVGGRVRVISHGINRGLGAALATGFHVARTEQADIIVTYDGDGQHNPDDIPALVAVLKRGDADVVIGSRRSTLRTMPWYRVVMNAVANFATLCIFGVWSEDTQSGLRAFTAEALRHIDIRTNGMEVSSEIIAEAASKKQRIAYVPITVAYTTYSLSKGQNLRVGIRTFFRLLTRRLM